MNAADAAYFQPTFAHVPDPRERAILECDRAKRWSTPQGWRVYGERLYVGEPLRAFHADFGDANLELYDDGEICLHRPGGETGDFLQVEHLMVLCSDGSGDTNDDPGFPPILIYSEMIGWLDQYYPTPTDCSQEMLDQHDKMIMDALCGKAKFWQPSLRLLPEHLKFREEDVAALDRLKGPVRALDLRALVPLPNGPEGPQAPTPPRASCAPVTSCESCPLPQTEAFLARFVAYPSAHHRLAHALWIIHSHLMQCWESTPRLAFLSPEPGSGKTRALEVTALLVPRPVESVNVTSAYLFRKIADPAGSPTVLFDEADTIFGPRAKEHEDVRGMLNAGHRRGATAGRCVIRGKAIETEELPAYCAVAIAGIGNLPDTILSRSIVVRMRRRRPDETIEAFRRREIAPQGQRLRDEIAAWCNRMSPLLKNARPEMPQGIEDRAADVWEPLLSIADAAGGDYASRAREAATAIVSTSADSAQSLGLRCLADTRAVFGSSAWMSTEDLLQALRVLPEAPWSDLRGHPIDSRRLAALLRPYGVHPKSFRCGTTVMRGYAREDLVDPWLRYLAPLPE